MRLKDRVANREHKTAATKERIMRQAQSTNAKYYGLFLRIIDRLIENLDDYDNVCYRTSSEVFNEIEKRNINVSDIISNSDYDTFKEQILHDNVPCPCIGGKIIQSQIKDGDCVEYLRAHPDMRF